MTVAAEKPQPPLTAKTLREAEEFLARRDRTMARVIAANGALRMRRAEPPFHSLCVSVINQQLSQKAAATIAGRVAEAAGGALFLPEAVARVSEKRLRAAGLSANKADFLRALAAAAQRGELEAAELRKLGDGEIVRRLTTIRGVGIWTAEMFLMFALRRPDVVSPGDAGLRRAAFLHYGKGKGGEEVLINAAKKWIPFRTVGCLHLWRSLR